MGIKLEIFAGAAADAVKNALSYISIDTFDAVEKIVEILEKKQYIYRRKA